MPGKVNIRHRQIIFANNLVGTLLLCNNFLIALINSDCKNLEHILYRSKMFFQFMIISIVTSILLFLASKSFENNKKTDSIISQLDSEKIIRQMLDECSKCHDYMVKICICETNCKTLKL